MQELIQKKIDILNKIDAVIEKAEKAEDESSLAYRQQIVLILTNLSNSLDKCDEKYLLKQILENIYSNIQSLAIQTMCC
jgi:hypothetical protein